MKLNKAHTRPNIVVVFLISIFMCLIGTEAVFADETFKNPKVDGTALDFCRDWGTNCGKAAADAYCRKKGYGKAITFRSRNNSPPTRVINSGQVCDQPFCHRITSVTCGGGQRID